MKKEQNLEKRYEKFWFFPQKRYFNAYQQPAVPYGIGSLGQYARDFVDFLVKTEQTCWQILPINPTAYGDSPYQSPCS